MSETQPTSSTYINDCYRNYSMYVLKTRAFPQIADGLKAGARRLLWTARNGDKYKTAALAGATMPLHPHADASDTIDTLTKPYANNIPLFHGIGSFGTRLKPDACGASRYTSVKVSNFTQDVLFRDIELVPLIDNYDSTLKEPAHFLPLVPIALINPSEGIGVGFSCTILPRALADIVDSQIAHLTGRPIIEPNIVFNPFNARSTHSEVAKSGNTRYWFQGEFTRLDSSTVVVTNLPYGTTHAKFVAYLAELVESGLINDYEDRSDSAINITVKFGRGALKIQSDKQLMSSLDLTASVVENMNLVDFTGERVMTTNYTSVIQEFTEWRLKWYLDRYLRLTALLDRDIQRYRDVILAIDNDVGSVGRTCADRGELAKWLRSIGVVYDDYVADLPIYRLTIDEAKKAQKRLDDALVVRVEYQSYIDDPDKRRALYVRELEEIKVNHKPVLPSVTTTAPTKRKSSKK